MTTIKYSSRKAKTSRPSTRSTSPMDLPFTVCLLGSADTVLGDSLWIYSLQMKPHSSPKQSGQQLLQCLQSQKVISYYSQRLLVKAGTFIVASKLKNSQHF